jgi:hypothetical protein
LSRLISDTCLLIFPVLNYLKLVLLHLRHLPVKHNHSNTFCEIATFIKQPNVTMTPEHIMQTRFPTRKNFFCLTGLKMTIGVAFCGCQAAKVTIYSEDKNRGEAAKVRVFPTRKNCLFFLTGLKIVVGVGFCKIKVDSNFSSCFEDQVYKISSRSE